MKRETVFAWLLLGEIFSTTFYMKFKFLTIESLSLSVQTQPLFVALFSGIKSRQALRKSLEINLNIHYNHLIQK